ncbi:MAG: hypothetical protein ABF289_04075 [Clostridiales bacterium]
MKKFNLLLVLLLFLVTLNSTFYFLFTIKVSVVDWIVLNPCAISNYVFLVGFIVYQIKGNKIIMYFAILPMTFFGGIGLIIFPWDGIYNLIPQFSHILMTLAIIVTIYSTFKNNNFKEAFIGCIIGILLFSGFIAYQQRSVYQNPDKLNKILGISLEKN